MWRMAGYVDGLGGFRRILIDHRGHGKSDRPGDVAAHRIEEYRDDVIAVLNDAGEHRVTFLGYSHGATVGCAIAADYPERVAGLIDLDGLEPDDLSSLASRQASLELAKAVHRTGMESKVREWAKEEGYSGPDWFLENLSETDSRVFETLLEAEGSWNGPASVLPRLKIPILSLWAGNRSPEEVARVRALLPGVRIRVIPHVGHLGIFVRADLLVAEIRSFAEEVAGPSKSAAP
jgi:pimeloyl-ACP methyl ester carboxylesterase